MTYEQQLWTRKVDTDFGPVEQFLRFDAETGRGIGWEVYEDGRKSPEIDLGSDRTLPLGFQKVEA